MISSCMGPKPSDGCPYGTDTETQKRRPCDHRDRGWSDRTASQGPPGATRSWKRQEGFFPEASRRREHGSVHTLILDVWTPVAENKCVLF